MPSNGAASKLRLEGRSFKAVHRPTSASEVGEILRDADNLKKPLAPIGGGSALALGNTPDAIGDALDMTAISRVLHFEPADLTLSVEAGARFADVQATLAERGQTLPIDTPDADRATIGGLIATALAGPRRLGSGTLRDLLIGIAVAYPSGIIAKAGGLVVKNVTGFDMMRLHHGALGTLGVIVSANFKTVPLHRAETTLMARFGSLDAAFGASDRIRSSRIQPLALEILKADDAYELAARIAGRASTVDLLADEGRSILSADVTMLSNAESIAWWAGYVQAQSLMRSERVLIHCGAAPKDTAGMATRALAIVSERGLAPNIVAISPGLGSMVVSVHSDSLTAKSLAGLQSDLFGASAHVTILSAPTELKEGVDVWGRQPETLSVMQALKAEFDPNRIINPGRLVGRI